MIGSKMDFQQNCEIVLMMELAAVHLLIRFWLNPSYGTAENGSSYWNYGIKIIIILKGQKIGPCIYIISEMSTIENVSSETLQCWTMSSNLKAIWLSCFLFFFGWESWSEQLVYNDDIITCKIDTDFTLGVCIYIYIYVCIKNIYLVVNSIIQLLLH